MDVFGQNWLCHDEKIQDYWRNTVLSEDIVLIPGDICWATKLEDAQKDLEFIDKLPGHKVLIRGNHDYWWATKSKMNKLGLNSIDYIVNDSVVIGDYGICGVRGWSLYEMDSQEDNEKIFKRELLRLDMSLKTLSNYSGKKIVLLHFPPSNEDKSSNDFVEVMKNNRVDVCLYGHLHGEEGHKMAVEGRVDGIDFYCVSCDYLDFKVKEIKI
jgi:Predicted phosphohydrolase